MANDINPFYALLMVVAFAAFIGIGIYTIIGGCYMLGASGAESQRRSRREMLALIPRSVRSLGKISFAIFFGCLGIGMVMVIFSR